MREYAKLAEVNNIATDNKGGNPFVIRQEAGIVLPTEGDTTVTDLMAPAEQSKKAAVVEVEKKSKKGAAVVQRTGRRLVTSVKNGRLGR